MLRAFRRGLEEAGYVEGRNVAIEYRWAEDQIDRLPALAAELVSRQVAAIVTGGDSVAPWSRPQPPQSPSSSSPPKTRSGLVSSPASPGRAATPPGSNFLATELTAKRLELLQRTGSRRHAGSRARQSGQCLESPSPRCATRKQPPAPVGLQIQVVRASTGREIDAAFAHFRARASGRPLRQHRHVLHQPARPTGPLGIAPEIPATNGQRDFAHAGGLMSYGSDITDA